MDVAGGNPDLRAEPEFPAIAELGRGVPQRHGAIHAAQELVGCGGVLGDDGVGVLAAMGSDMGQRCVNPINDGNGQDCIQPFGIEITSLSGRQPWHDPARRRIGSERASQRLQVVHQQRQQNRRYGLVDQQRLRRAAYSGSPHLSVGDDPAGHFRIGRPVHVGVVQPLGVGQDRHSGLALHPLHQRLTAARDDQVKQAGACQHCRHIGSVGIWRHLDTRLRQPGRRQPAPQRYVDGLGAVRAVRPAAQDHRIA